jgi:hypothetical protein
MTERIAADQCVANAMMRRVATPSHSDDEQDAVHACALLCRQAFQIIRASAFRREAVDAPPIFDGDYVEWIRLLADACDGLAQPGAGKESAAEALVYRRSVWNAVQEAWVDSVLRP